jgi:hypothetical protein
LLIFDKNFQQSEISKKNISKQQSAIIGKLDQQQGP